ncbi:MAG: RrF2 family transcriptional regulator [Bryobacteraceae bacterium]
MLYSRAAEYAIRAFVYLARQPEGQYAMTRTIAQAEQIPGHFLAKILQDLARKGMLRSVRGPSGGFCLRMPAGQIKLLQIVEAMDGPAIADSANRIPWALDSWRPLHSRIMDSLGQSTILDIAKEIDAQAAAAKTGAEKNSRLRKSLVRKK